MKSISPIQLEAMIESGRPVELIDVRTPEAFSKLHAKGARSVPLREFAPTSFLRTRQRPRGEPVYMMSRNETLARLAAEELGMAGFDQAVIVRGGVEAWSGTGLPVARKNPVLSRFAACLSIGSVIVFGLAFALVSQSTTLAGVILLVTAWLIWCADQSEPAEFFPLHSGDHRYD